MADPVQTQVIVSADPFSDAARLVVGVLERVQEDRGFARFAIPGGSVVKVVSLVRAAMPVTWGKVRLTWVDERCVPLDDDASNRGAAIREARIDWPSGPEVVLPLWLDGEKRAAAMDRVLASLAKDFGNGLDLALYGLGEDGHVASLFPGHHALTDTGGYTFIGDSPKPPARRATLTLELLKTAALSVVVAAGEPKRKALERLVAGDPALPATQLPNLVVITDLELGVKS